MGLYRGINFKYVPNMDIPLVVGFGDIHIIKP